MTASFSSTVINAKVHALVDVTTMDTQSLVPNESSKECKNNFEKKNSPEIFKQVHFMSNEEANLEKIDNKKIYFSKKTGSLLFTLLRMSSGCVPVQQMLNVEKMHVH